MIAVPYRAGPGGIVKSKRFRRRRARTKMPLEKSHILPQVDEVSETDKQVCQDKIIPARLDVELWIELFRFGPQPLGAIGIDPIGPQPIREVVQ